MPTRRVYVDTSVIGGCLDDEFAADSKRLIEEAAQGRLILLLSDIVIRELEGAPAEVQGILAGLPTEAVSAVPITSDVEALRDAYLLAGVLGTSSVSDATHVAAATVARADAIVSWNFRHIVNLDKIKGYNAVNLTRGYGLLVIVTPREVISRDTD